MAYTFVIKAHERSYVTEGKKRILIKIKIKCLNGSPVKSLLHMPSFLKRIAISLYLSFSLLLLINF